jgi:CBS domain-containing protein
MYRNQTIKYNCSLLEALTKMDELDKKLLIVFDDRENYQGLLSVGDIQRAIIKNKPLVTPIKEVMRSNIRVAKPTDSFELVKEMMLDYRM